jgi:hypothetical protein
MDLRHQAVVMQMQTFSRIPIQNIAREIVGPTGKQFMLNC